MLARHLCSLDHRCMMGKRVGKEGGERENNGIICSKTNAKHSFSREQTEQKIFLRVGGYPPASKAQQNRNKNKPAANAPIYKV